jgi:hypothetical protein
MIKFIAGNNTSARGSPAIGVVDDTGTVVINPKGEKSTAQTTAAGSVASA